ncbi:MAG: beta-lactamase family protein [Bacteroidetes bacterium]|nr:beta-lactamase family protein [Bacteroidota bacterium]
MKRPLTFLLSLITLNSFTQPIDKARLDSLFDNLTARNLAIGSITITQKGQPVYQRSFGNTQPPGNSQPPGNTLPPGNTHSPDKSQPPIPNPSQATTYRLGSITKLFTAVMIYDLIDKKRLSLDDTLSEFFPDLPDAGRITIADMLGHRSGLANFTAPATSYDTWKSQPHTHDQLVAFIKSQPQDFRPGAKADYNNSNFLLLGYILEKIHHRSYKDLVNEKIIHKLGLHDTYYGDHPGFEAKECPSYKYFDNKWQEETAVYLDNFGGAGAMISTPQDMCRFITAIFGGKLISRTSLARMTRIEKDGYGWGMFSFGDSLHTGYGHNGKTEGFASSLQYYPENRLAIGYCTNGEVYPKDRILTEVFKICFKEPVAIPTFIPVTLSQDLLQPYTGTYEGDNGLQLTGTITNGSLVLKVKGQQFPLEAMSDHEFRNTRFGFFFEFEKGGEQLVVHDAAVTYWLHKRK